MFDICLRSADPKKFYALQNIDEKVWKYLIKATKAKLLITVPLIRTSFGNWRHKKTHVKQWKMINSNFPPIPPQVEHKYSKLIFRGKISAFLYRQRFQKLVTNWISRQTFQRMKKLDGFLKHIFLLPVWFRHILCGRYICNELFWTKIDLEKFYDHLGNSGEKSSKLDSFENECFFNGLCLVTLLIYGDEGVVGIRSKNWNHYFSLPTFQPL